MHPGRLLTNRGLRDGDALVLTKRLGTGVVATAMHCVNAIPYVCRAEPGLLTYLEMPLVAGRAASALHRDRRA